VPGAGGGWGWGKSRGGGFFLFFGGRGDFEGDAEADGGAAGGGGVGVAGGGKETGAVEVPGAAAEGAVFAGAAVEVVAPFPDVAAEVVEAEFVGGVGIDGGGEGEFVGEGAVVVAPAFLGRVFASPGVVAGFFAAGGGVGFVLEGEADGGAPFEVGGEAVEVARGELADPGFAGGEPFAEGGGVVPGDVDDGVGGAGGVGLVGGGDVGFAAVAEVVEDADGPDAEEGVEAWDGDEALPEGVDEGFVGGGGDAGGRERGDVAGDLAVGEGGLELGRAGGDGEGDAFHAEGEEFVLAEAVEHFGEGAGAHAEDLLHGGAGRGRGRGGGRRRGLGGVPGGGARKEEAGTIFLSL